MKELAWLGCASISIYLFHMFIAWILSRLTGFPLRYEDPAPASVVSGSILLTASGIALSVLAHIAIWKLKSGNKNRAGILPFSVLIPGPDL